jgi:predicted RNA-binding protein with PIN domain
MKRELITRLVRYTSKVPHTLIVVFDGGKEYETTTTTNRLSIIHAGPNQTADTVIESLIEVYKNSEAVVITKDRTIRTYAGKIGVATVTPLQFLERVALREMSTTPKKPRTDYFSIRQYHSSDESIDELMRNAALIEGISHKTESGSSTRERPSHTPSSQERTLLALLEKL